MSHLLLCLAVGFQASDERPPHPLAPSIPLLSKDEVKRVEEIIDRFIDFDIGKLKGAGGKKALEDFNGLGREAIFQLIDGFNRGANMESSCPCVIIGRKISRFLTTSDDIHLLAFARENIGAGVTAKRHMAVVEDLRVAAMLRRAAVVRAGGGEPPRGPLAKKSLEELADLVRAGGKQTRSAVEELGRRTDPKVADILAESDDPQARATLQKWIAKQPVRQMASLLKHGLAPVREIAAQQAVKQRSLAGDLIDLLADKEEAVVQAARRSLASQAGRDHGPEQGASATQRDESISRWRSWLEMRKK
jgi:hypothetical protein